MRSLISAVQISTQERLCARAFEVTGHSHGRRKYKHHILTSDLCRDASCEKLAALERFPFRSSKAKGCLSGYVGAVLLKFDLSPDQQGDISHSEDFL